MERISQKKHDVADAVYEYFDLISRMQDRLAKAELEQYALQARLEDMQKKLFAMDAKIVFLEEKVASALRQ